MLIASSLALGLPSLVLMPHPTRAYGQSLILAAFYSPANFLWPAEVEVMVKYASLPPYLPHIRNSGHMYAGTAQPAASAIQRAPNGHAAELLKMSQLLVGGDNKMRGHVH